jgi:uncharacterized glyoxalase superfamily protein PhnB
MRKLNAQRAQSIRIEKNIPLEFDLREEVWGDRHFAIRDPNGIGIDFVTNKTTY